MSIVDNLGTLHARVTGASPAAVRSVAAFEIADLLAVPHAAWVDLAARAIEPNPYFHPGWARAGTHYAEGKSGGKVLLVWHDAARTRLIGLLPVVSAWRAMRIPIPVWVAWQAYAPLTTPLLDRDKADEAARGLLNAAALAGAYGVLLPLIAEDGPAAAALRRAAAEFNVAPVAFARHERARLDATLDAEAAVGSLGAKKLKELRRQRNRLADNGEVAFKIAAPGDETSAALDAFLSLEGTGWKGKSGTALAAKAGDAQFIKTAIADMAATGEAVMATLSAGGKVVAAGMLLKHLRRGYFAKVAYDETAAKMSPGVQITLDITRHFCADAGVDDVDSTAVADHPMIDHIWRSRLAVCDLLVPARPGKIPFAVLASAIGARRIMREAARSLYHRIRSLKGK